MAVPNRIEQAKGEWRGNSLLHLSYLPPDEQVTASESTMQVEIDENGAFATIVYQWTHEGKQHVGKILLAQADDSKAVQMGWVDSWHQSGGVLHLVGEESDSGGVKAGGTYLAGDEVWGWNIGFELSPETSTTPETLTMTMENVVPSEGPEWAVRATYSRTG